MTVFKEYFQDSNVKIILRLDDMVMELGNGSDQIDVNCTSPEYFVWYCMYPDNIIWAFFISYCKGLVTIKPSLLKLYINAHLKQDAIAIASKSDFKSLIQQGNIKYSSKTLISKRFQIGQGIFMLKLEWFLFKSIATFHDGSDTWNLATRCKMLLESTEEPIFNWDGISELNDSFTNIQKEKIRASFLQTNLD